jgi:hypothetical protein
MRVPAILASALIAGGVLAGGVSPAIAMTATESTEVAQLQATAHTAQAAIAANAQDMKAMQMAIDMRSVSQAKVVLEKHGFTAAQLDQGVIVFSHALLPKKVKQGQFYYMEIDPKPFKISVHGLPSM